MVFNSFSFWLIFPLIFGIYWLIPSKQKELKKWFLIVVSYLLYMNWNPAFALALMFVTGVTYYGSHLISDANDQKKNKHICMLTVVLGVSLLVIFKYYNFINDNINALLSWLHLQVELPGLNYAIPVGISFFTFQAIGYFLDVYLKKIEAEKSLSDYVLFVSFFPQVSSGPISKASELLPQIKNPKPFNEIQATDGLRYLLWGMFMKVAVADRLEIYVDTIYGHYLNYSGFNSFVSMLYYSFQIYADFAGYSLMALGIAKLLGYDIVNNFQQPYFAFSITNFWRRWHISLSRWLKDYIYIPLGGSRCSSKRSYFNIFITFLVSGIWHGASWNFIIWGALHGIFQIIEKALHLQKEPAKGGIIKAVRIVITFFLVSFAWIFFRMPTLNDAIGLIVHTVKDFTSFDILQNQRIFILFTLPIVIMHDIYLEYFSHKQYWWNNTITRWMLYVTLFILILIVGVLDSGQFIYVSF